MQESGVGGLYRGLGAGLLRQATYTTARLGIHQIFTTELKKANDGKPLPLWQKAGAGLAAGGLGALVGSPADLSLVRMQVCNILCPWFSESPDWGPCRSLLQSHAGLSCAFFLNFKRALIGHPADI